MRMIGLLSAIQNRGVVDRATEDDGGGGERDGKTLSG